MGWLSRVPPPPPLARRHFVAPALDFLGHTRIRFGQHMRCAAATRQYVGFKGNSSRVCSAYYAQMYSLSTLEARLSVLLYFCKLQDPFFDSAVCPSIGTIDDDFFILVLLPPPPFPAYLGSSFCIRRPGAQALVPTLLIW